MLPFPALSTAAGVALGSAAGTGAWAALSASSQLFGPVVVAPPRPGEVLLTFDDGPNPAATPALLDVLAQHGILATFFVIGNFARQEPALVRALVEAGHTVGNHTLTHPWLHLQPESRIRAELADTNHLLEDILGAPVTLFRPPHGARRPAVLRVARSLGLLTVNWNIMVGDWKPVPAATLALRLQRGLQRVRRRGYAGNVVLHDGGHAALGAPRLATVEAVDRLLLTLRDAPELTTFVPPEAWLPQSPAAP